MTLDILFLCHNDLISTMVYALRYSFQKMIKSLTKNNGGQSYVNEKNKQQCAWPNQHF